MPIQAINDYVTNSIFARIENERKCVDILKERKIDQWSPRQNIYRSSGITIKEKFYSRGRQSVMLKRRESQLNP